jgi:hypothetical protein
MEREEHVSGANHLSASGSREENHSLQYCQSQSSARLGTSEQEVEAVPGGDDSYYANEINEDCTSLDEHGRGEQVFEGGDSHAKKSCVDESGIRGEGRNHLRVNYDAHERDDCRDGGEMRIEDAQRLHRELLLQKQQSEPSHAEELRAWSHSQSPQQPQKGYDQHPQQQHGQQRHTQCTPEASLRHQSGGGNDADKRVYYGEQAAPLSSSRGMQGFFDIHGPLLRPPSFRPLPQLSIQQRTYRNIQSGLPLSSRPQPSFLSQMQPNTQQRSLHQVKRGDAGLSGGGMRVQQQEPYEPSAIWTARRNLYSEANKYGGRVGESQLLQQQEQEQLEQGQQRSQQIQTQPYGQRTPQLDR